MVAQTGGFGVVGLSEVDWAAVDTYKRQLERLGFKDVDTHKRGTSLVLIDFHFPGVGRQSEQRAVKSTLVITTEPEYKRFMLRLPQVFLPRLQTNVSAVIMDTLGAVMDDYERQVDRFQGSAYRGHVSEWGFETTFLVEPISAEEQSVHIHISHGEETGVKDPEPSIEEVIRVLGEMWEGFRENIESRRFQ